MGVTYTVLSPTAPDCQQPHRLVSQEDIVLGTELPLVVELLVTFPQFA